MFETMQNLTGIPWYYLAAMNQYEKNVARLAKNKPKQTGLISIQVPSYLWAGKANPYLDDMKPASIHFFSGMGKDANGDGLANRQDDLDLLYSVSLYLLKQGTTETNIREQLWQYYQHPITVDIITHIAKIFLKYNRIDLDEYTFPIPRPYSYSYRDTWGAGRGWGGRRIHEGTDIFAGYGTPVLSTCYGYVELMGWNRFGGWRIGIRDIHNNYHYFAHLAGFRKGLKQGDIVKPGERIGTVGSTGYGPPGTAGKFPPHLHYGLYKFNGRNTYSIDPYPSLKKWERQTLKKKKGNQLK
ncbi:Peptidase family M23 [Thermoflavimicrobium dichotomicum]|uniref:Peptidase family M23 n=2 Tax=Thermoflavimicrobium dichotomicum TaxID=46223 RepID=A0A1I3LTL6_9BACL|nr:M23 family metallopeptidase [Thermoflavimicrobium dichotomicum]SFI87855.1 Peptidase family M23 [Thermoflavimicrobium dichotomicum]